TWWSWMALILPFVEQDNLWNQANQWAQTDPVAGTTAWNGNSWYWWPWGDFWTAWSNTKTPNPALGTVVKLYICPSEIRNLGAEPINWGYGGPADAIAFTEYLGVNGLSGDLGSAPDPSGTVPPPDYSGILVESDYGRGRKVNFASVSDGSSNTLMIGERPPSVNLAFGWWFAGAGYDGS